MSRNSKSKSGEKHSSNYKTSRRWEANRKKRLERALKAQPENEQIKTALKQMVYRRRVPTNRMWSASAIALAKLFKEFNGRFDPAILSSNQDAARSALQRFGPHAANFKLDKAAQSDKNFFSIGARVNLNSPTQWN